MSLLTSQPGEPELKKYLPPRHEDTKDLFIIPSSCLGVLEAIKNTKKIIELKN
jgi:hypothetical protein